MIEPMARAPSREHPPIGLRRGQFVAIACFFWLYVALANVLYASSMGAGIAKMTSAPLFAPWNVRVLQHALMLPALLLSFWASLRLGWRPAWLAPALQFALAAAFSATGYPAMIAAFLVLGGPHWVDTIAAHSPNPWLDPTFLWLWFASAVSFFLAYGFGLALITGLALYTRLRDSQLQVAELEREWSAARLAALRMQLSPHTLFNLLHTIRGQIAWDPKTAQAMVLKFADLLRRLLSAGERELSTLAEEVQFVRSYLDLQATRFEDRLTVVLPEPESLPRLLVPSLILQPLVENAVVHGLAGHQGPVRVRIGVAGSPDRLTLTIENGIAPGREPGAEGIGLRNVRERLAVQFAGRAALRATRTDDRWIAEIEMPAVRP